LGFGITHRVAAKKGGGNSLLPAENIAAALDAGG
jgi:hypothetical protein